MRRARRGLCVAPERIALTASTSEAYGCLFKLLVDAGDEVIVSRPSYPLLDHLARLDQVTARQYDLDPNRGWRIDFESLERALSRRTRAIIIVSPNNPTGSFVQPEEVQRLADIASAHDAPLIADEVFADYELAAGARSVAGRVADRGDVLTFSLGGLSKSVGLPQVELAWIAAAGPRPQVDEALERLELVCDTYLSVSTPVQLAADDLLVRGAIVRERIASRVSANYLRLSERVASTGACRTLASEGGWYAVLDVPSLESEESLVLDLLRSYGVLTYPGHFSIFLASPIWS